LYFVNPINIAMKITEVTRLSRKRIIEEIAKENDTGFLAEDLARIMETHDADCWSEPMTADELLAEMDSWDNE
jgi:hypothetical protein